jgi:hypothetical protein
MKFPRSTFRTTLYQFVTEQRKKEREEYGYTMDSGWVAAMQELLDKTEEEVSYIELVD